MDLEKIKQNYANLDDSKIIQIAQNEIASLHPDVVMILVGEIRERGLDANLVRAIHSQVTEIGVSKLLSRIINLPCPECGDNTSPLIGKWIREVKSFIIGTTTKKYSMIACKDCTKERWNSAMLRTTFMGWWGFPTGLIYTPYNLIVGFKDNKKESSQSHEILTRFVVANRGELIAHFEDEEYLVDFVRFKNGFN